MLVGLAPAAVAAYLFLLGPGQAWWRGRASALPRLFCRVALSVGLTSLIGLGLVAFDAFSLPRLVAINAALTLSGYLLVGRVRYQSVVPAIGAGLGGLIFAVALCCYWPAYEAHFAASDASAYAAGGIHLAREHQLWKHDDIAEYLPPRLRQRLFYSVLGMAWKPPYARMPGGLVIETPTSDVVRPAFFPLPVIWSALFADALGPRHVGGYAPLFCALALWATWYFARRRMGAAAAVATTVLVGANAASYWAAKMPLSEPLAWFFLWSGLVALDAWEDEGFAGDARLGALLLGLAGTTRIEFLIFIVAALAIRRLLGGALGGRPTTAGFCLVFAATTAVTAAEAWTLRGAYLVPLADTVRGLQYLAIQAWNGAAPTVVASAVTAAALALLAARRFGLINTVLAGSLAAFVLVYTRVAAHSQTLRSIVWLYSYLGVATLALALPGLIDTWRRRHEVPGNTLFIILTVFFGGLLIYSPHVIASMPWASRRFVPLLVPAILILAASSCSRIARRSLAAGAVAWLALAGSVLQPLPALWNRGYYDGSSQQLAEFAALLPKRSVLLIDGRLTGFVLSTPLWLAHDINSLPVFAGHRDSRKDIRTTVASLAPHRPVFLLKSTLAPAEPIAGLAVEHYADYSFAVRLPEQTEAKPPRLSQNYVQPVSIYRLTVATNSGKPQLR